MSGSIAMENIVYRLECIFRKMSNPSIVTTTKSILIKNPPRPFPAFFQAP